MKVSRRISRQEWADFKRLLELCAANPAWREEFFEQPQEWLDRYAFGLSAEMSLEGVRLMGCTDREKRQANPYVREHDELIGKIHAVYREKLSCDRIVNSRFRAWYKRQAARCNFQSSFSRHQYQEGLFYLPVTFELTDGCSIGCPFCCLAAGGLKSVFPYTEQNGEFWRSLLVSTKEVIGSAAGMSVCYFATEPFDNPDYEKFLVDYYQIFRRYPQTTTAASVADVRRTKEFLELLGEEQLQEAAVRFSVVSLEQLQQIHKEFTPQELAYVELLLNNRESVNVYSKAGRSIGLAKVEKDAKFLDDASCVCTCGFVVNLPKREITLLAPHRPDKKHPLGMRVYEKRIFGGVEEYRRALLEMTEKWMQPGLPKDKPLYPAAFIAWEQTGYRLKARGDKISRTISLSGKEQSCFEQMMKQNLSLQEVCKVEQLTEFEKKRFQEKLAVLYHAGCLDETNL